MSAKILAISGGLHEEDRRQLALLFTDRKIVTKNSPTVVVVGTGDPLVMSRIFPNHKVRVAADLASANCIKCDTIVLWGGERPTAWPHEKVQLMHLSPEVRVPDPNGSGEKCPISAFIDGSWQNACLFRANSFEGNDTNWASIALALKYRGYVVRETSSPRQRRRRHA